MCFRLPQLEIQFASTPEAIPTPLTHFYCDIISANPLGGENETSITEQLHKLHNGHDSRRPPDPLTRTFDCLIYCTLLIRTSKSNNRRALISFPRCHLRRKGKL